MKRYLLALTGMFFLFLIGNEVVAAEGDTTIITSHNKQHMKFPPGNRTYTNKTAFPDGTVKYRKILLEYTLGCPPGGCSTWDYTTSVQLRKPSGRFDSTLTQLPYFTVDGDDPDSASYSKDTTYVTFFDTTNKVTDSVVSSSLFFLFYQNSANPTLKTDSLTAFAAGYYKYYYNTAGVIIDSTYVPGDSTLYQSYYNVYTPFEIIDIFELGRLITPYFGDYYPYTFTFDVTDYAPLLRDSADISLVFSGWQDGFLATLDFIFIEGTPPRDPKRVMSLYNGSFQYGRVNNPIENHLVPKDFDFKSDEKYASLHYTPSGHSFGGNENCAEFCAKNYFVYVNNTLRYTNLMWREDCGENPLYPQGGTWIYDRANWCPGLDAIRNEHELGQYLNFGQMNTLNIDLQPYTYNGSAAPGTTPNPSYTINSSVITFGAANFSLDAEVADILTPNDHILKNRSNPICGKPTVRIRNTGSTTLTSLVINYGPKGGKKAEYTWNGNLPFLSSAIVELPNPDWSPWNGPNVYEVSVSSPNGSNDEYAANNTLTSTFEIPDMLPSDIVIYFRGGEATQNQYGIRDMDGNTVFSNTSPSNNVAYSDTVNLEDGCYEFYITDAAQDGLRFFGQTKGALVFREATQKNKELKGFELEFGSKLTYRFTVGYRLTGINDVNLSAGDESWVIYPNPTKGEFTIEMQNFDSKTLELSIYQIMGNEVYSGRLEGNGSVLQQSVNLSDYPAGIYTVVLKTDKGMQAKKIILQ